MGVTEDLASGERLLADVAASLIGDLLGEDPGTLAELGRLRARLDAAEALAEREGGADEAAILARSLLLELFGAFPSRLAWAPDRSDEALHLRHEAIGRALLSAETRL